MFNLAEVSVFVFAEGSESSDYHRVWFRKATVRWSHLTAQLSPLLLHTHSPTFASHVSTCGRAGVQFSEEEAPNLTR